MGGASRWWLHHALTSLNVSLDCKLNIYAGDPQQVLSAVALETSAQGVFWNRCYEPQSIARDAAIKASLKASGLAVQSFNGSLLWEQWQVVKKDGTSYKVFTPLLPSWLFAATRPPPAAARAKRHAAAQDRE